MLTVQETHIQPFFCTVTSASVLTGEFLEEAHRVLEAKLSPVSRKITDSRPKTREELDTLYHQIITYILLRSDLGSPSDAKIVQEATGVTINNLWVGKRLVTAFNPSLKCFKQSVAGGGDQTPHPLIRG